MIPFDHMTCKLCDHQKTDETERDRKAIQGTGRTPDCTGRTPDCTGGECTQLEHPAQSHLDVATSRSR